MYCYAMHCNVVSCNKLYCNNLHCSIFSCTAVCTVQQSEPYNRLYCTEVCTVHCGQGGWMGVIVGLLLMSTTATMGGQDNHIILLYMFDTYVKDWDITLIYFFENSQLVKYGYPCQGLKGNIFYLFCLFLPLYDSLKILYLQNIGQDWVILVERVGRR